MVSYNFFVNFHSKIVGSHKILVLYPNLSYNKEYIQKIEMVQR